MAGIRQFIKGALSAEEAATVPVTSGSRISQRYPTATQPRKTYMGGALEDPIADDLVVDVQSMVQDPRQAAQALSVLQEYPQLRIDRRYNPEGQIQQATEQMAENLTYLYDEITPDIRNRAKVWYEGANRQSQALAAKYGTSNESAAGVIAAMSPQKDWFMNASLADRLMRHYNDAVGGAKMTTEHADKLKELYKQKKYSANVQAATTKPFAQLNPEQKAMWLRSRSETMDDAAYPMVEPEGTQMGPVLKGDGDPASVAWGSNNEIAKAIAVLEDPSIENISATMGKAHKVRNFYNNIVDPMHAFDNPMVGDTTIDTHAVGANLLSPMSATSGPVSQAFGQIPEKVTGTPVLKDQIWAPYSPAGPGSSGYSGIGGTYPIHAEAVRMAAKEKGIQPREMQSITWEGVRNLFPDYFKKNAGAMEDIRGLWQGVQDKKIPLHEARRLILERAMEGGGTLTPDWARAQQLMVNAGIPTVGISAMMGADPAAADTGALSDVELREGVPQTSRPALSEQGAEETQYDWWDDIRGVGSTAAALGHHALTGIGGLGQQLGASLAPWLSEEEALQQGALAEQEMERGFATGSQLAADPNAQRFYRPTLQWLDEQMTGFGEDVERGFGRSSPLYRNVPGYAPAFDWFAEEAPAAYEELNPRARMGAEAAGGLLF